jgi:hypothetical protein
MPTQNAVKVPDAPQQVFEAFKRACKENSVWCPWQKEWCNLLPNEKAAFEALAQKALYIAMQARQPSRN